MVTSLGLFECEEEICKHLNSLEMQRQIHQVGCGTDEPHKVAKIWEAMEAKESGSKSFVLGVLLTQLGVAFLVGAQAHIIP